MPKEQKPEHPLSAAATQFAYALKKFEDVSGSLQRSDFGSQKALERGADMLRQAAEVEDSLSAHGRDLALALAEARKNQEAQAAIIRTKAEELAARTEVFRQLMERFAQLGQQASNLNELVKGLGQQGDGAAQIGDVAGDLDKLATDSEGLATDAGAQQFGEVSRQADSLRQQVLSVKNRLELLFKKLPVS